MDSRTSSGTISGSKVTDVSIVGPSNADYVLIYGRLGRVLHPKTDPLGNVFLHGQPVREYRIDETRVIGLFKMVAGSEL